MDIVSINSETDFHVEALLNKENKKSLKSRLFVVVSIISNTMIYIVWSIKCEVSVVRVAITNLEIVISYTTRYITNK